MEQECVGLFTAVRCADEMLSLQVLVSVPDGFHEEEAEPQCAPVFAGQKTCHSVTVVKTLGTILAARNARLSNPVIQLSVESGRRIETG
jgi:hypothetical protein